MRLSMLVPFNLSNYVLGASSVKIRDFTLGTLGLLPLVAFFVYLGTTVSDIEQVVNGSRHMSKTEIVVLVIGPVAAIIGIIIVSVMVKRSLHNDFIDDDCVVADDVTESPVFPQSLIALKQEERCEDLELTTTTST